MQELRRSDLQHINKLLKEKGLKSTPQRAVILTYLEKTYAHPTAETIFNDIKKEYPSISLNTVYRTLELFEKKQIIFAIIDTNGVRRYDAHTKPHIHLVCTVCGKITDIDYDDRRVLGKIKEIFNPEKSIFCIYGSCKEHTEKSI